MNIEIGTQDYYLTLIYNMKEHTWWKFLTLVSLNIKKLEIKSIAINDVDDNRKREL